MPDESKAISMELTSGPFAIFWPTLMPASPPRVGKRSELRMGFVARYGNGGR